MGGRGRRIGGGAFGQGFSGFNDIGFGQDDDSFTNILGRDARPRGIENYPRQRGGGGGAASNPTPPRPARQRTQTRATTTTGQSGGGRAVNNAQAVASGENSRFTASLEKAYGIGKRGRDDATSANWNGNFTATASQSSLAQAKALFGKDVSARDLGLLVGAPDGARVNIDSLRSGSVTISVSHPFFSSLQRTVSKDSAGRLKVHNDIFRKGSGNAPKGLGGRQLAIQTAVARKLGVKYIDTSAASGGGWNGYYTWARVGFDAPLRGASLPTHLSRVNKVSDLMKFDAVQRRLGHKIDKTTGKFTSGRYKGQLSGSEWWKTNGGWTEMVFDLDKKSASSKVLAYWQKEQGVFGAGTEYTRGRTTRVVTQTSARSRRRRRNETT